MSFDHHLKMLSDVLLVPIVFYCWHISAMRDYSFLLRLTWLWGWREARVLLLSYTSRLTCFRDEVKRRYPYSEYTAWVSQGGMQIWFLTAWCRNPLVKPGLYWSAFWHRVNQYSLYHGQIVSN